MIVLIIYHANDHTKIESAQIYNNINCANQLINLLSKLMF